jgi:hypothetical protein
MSDRARRAGSYGRAAAEPLLDELASQSDELAKRWAIAMIEGSGPEGFAAIDLALVASEGPELIDGLLSGEWPSGRLARIAGDEGGRLARAAEALRRVLWEAAVEAVPRARSDTRAARRLLDAGDAIAAACAELLAAELDADADAGADAGAVERAPAVETPVGAAPGTRASGQPVVIIDEAHGAAPGARRVPEPPVAAPVSGDAPLVADSRRASVSHEESHPAPVAPFAPSIAARDARQGPAAWIGSIGAQLEAFRQDGRPFSVLLIEMLEPAAALDAESATRALQERLGQWRGLTLTREGPGRYWLVAPGADRAGAESLRDLVELPRGEAKGGPVAVGIAHCPEDGRDAAGLAAHADLDLYASRSRASERRAGRS